MKPSGLSPVDIARALGISEGNAWHMASKVAEYFKPPRRSMVKGKLRVLDVPIYPIKKRFKRLQKFLQKRLRPHAVAHGGVGGQGFLGNVGHGGIRWGTCIPDYRL